MKYTSLALALAGTLLLSGCSDDSGNTQDSGPRPDGVVQKDTINGGQEAGRPVDGSTDLPYNPVCEPACQAESRTLCVTDPAAGQCVQCTEDAHCAAMPDVDGPNCNTEIKKCVECREQAHCAAHPAGSVCYGNTCVCNTAADCSGTDRFGPECVQLLAYSRCGCQSEDAVCSGTTLGSKCFVQLNHKCVCFEQADCAGNGDKTACHLPYYYADYGHCTAPCTGDVQCKLDRLERCDDASGACVECTGDAHCAANLRGSKCLAKRCSCQTDDDCPEGTECADLFGIVQCR